MLRIRLQRKGRKKRPIWHIVVAERHEARDGRIVERVGRYDNVTEKKEVVLNEDRILYWLDTGAQPTDTVRKILRQEGVLYKRHLMNWGKSEEEIEKALAEWKEYRDSKKEDATSRKADYQEVLAAEEREYKEQLQKKAKQAAAEVEAEKAAADAEEDEAPKNEAEEIEAALEEAESDDSAEETTEAAEEETTEAEAEAKEEAADEAEEKTEAKEEAPAEDEAETEEDSAEAAEEETEEAAEEETKDEEPAEEEKEEAEEATSDKVSTDMNAKEAIDHINNTDLDDLKGFVPEDEDRVTVQRAWESKQEG
ncbi:MAG: 30S ribosomal protein S16 [Gracilimonas sp.]|uniref:30S ribosomal protein S16 n=1 Tax=Gracilimonas TaxID=649462 RepID=UPI001B10A6C5|nr:30S ribosomal protein S16 [Gracilimonas sp.]MBO6584809.1 30S ribosomal protein S16 [Gracilimonas sp.]MBO6615920.1 30S ribosomal protein S16 [Gracilimonas sp.]